ncbi:hypothetical protein M422DRAFT_121740, partial [Sphaerobolus stellatus SS14]
NKSHTVILVSLFEVSKFKPKTRWDGCQIFEENSYRFVLPKYLVRGCHMIPVFGSSEKSFHLNDLVDVDAFL